MHEVLSPVSPVPHFPISALPGCQHYSPSLNLIPRYPIHHPAFGHHRKYPNTHSIETALSFPIPGVNVSYVTFPSYPWVPPEQSLQYLPFHTCLHRISPCNISTFFYPRSFCLLLLFTILYTVSFSFHHKYKYHVPLIISNIIAFFTRIIILHIFFHPCFHLHQNPSTHTALTTILYQHCISCTSLNLLSTLQPYLV